MTQAQQMLAALAGMQGVDVAVHCPECGHEGPHETNGELTEPWAACSNCHRTWALEVQVTTPERTP